MPPADLLFNGCLAAYLAGGIAGLVSIWRPRRFRLLAFALALLGALSETAASWIAISQASIISWTLPSGVPLFAWSIRLDPLSAYFSLALGIVGTAVSIFSFGYLREWKSRSAGVLGFFYNILLLSLALVFTASNVFFFLVAWEVMALSAFCLVSFEHSKDETRKAGVLFLIMSHAGTGLLIIAFLVL